MEFEYFYRATITKVVDGDTIDATVDLGFNVFQNMRFRLAGIDTPEMNSQTTEQRLLALAAKQFVTELVVGKTLTIKTHKVDKYGRYLAEVYLYDDLNPETLNDLLLIEGFAVPYNGGTR